VAHSPNRLLAALPARVFATIQPHLKAVDMKGDVVAATGGSVSHVYFPHSGAISLVVEMSVGEMIETAMIGRDGVHNAASALDGKVSLNKGIVQLAGVTSVIDADKLRTIADDNKALRSIIIRHEQVLLAQSQQSAACNASHSLEARMCRWLMRMRDLADSDDLTLTQEFLAQMIGVRRSSVSIVAGTLQKAGFIRYRRGNIRIVDVAGLEQGCCECYAAVKRHYDRLVSG
jgi:CRP-like cAMP-binding protein